MCFYALNLPAILLLITRVPVEKPWKFLNCNGDYASVAAAVICLNISLLDKHLNWYNSLYV